MDWGIPIAKSRLPQSRRGTEKDRTEEGVPSGVVLFRLASGWPVRQGVAIPLQYSRVGYAKEGQNPMWQRPTLTGMQGNKIE
jgi:hypothetical protein